MATDMKKLLPELFEQPAVPWIVGMVDQFVTSDDTADGAAFASGEERWVTIGGHEEGDEKHVGGFPVKVSAEGTILTGKLKGVKVKDVKEHFDRERAGKTGEKEESESDEPTVEEINKRINARGEELRRLKMENETGGLRGMSHEERIARFDRIEQLQQENKRDLALLSRMEAGGKSAVQFKQEPEPQPKSQPDETKVATSADKPPTKPTTTGKPSAAQPKKTEQPTTKTGAVGYGYAGGVVNVPWTPERQKMADDAAAAKGDRDALARILGDPNKVQGYLQRRAGGANPKEALIRTMRWDDEAEQAAREEPAKSAEAVAPKPSAPEETKALPDTPGGFDFHIKKRPAHSMSADERKAEVEQLRSQFARELKVPLMSEGGLSPFQLGQMSPRQREAYQRDTQMKMRVQARIRDLSADQKAQEERAQAVSKDAASSRLGQIDRTIMDMHQVGRGASGKLKPKYQRTVDIVTAEAKKLLDAHPDLAAKYPDIARAVAAISAPEESK